MSFCTSFLQRYCLTTSTRERIPSFLSPCVAYPATNTISAFRHQALLLARARLNSTDLPPRARLQADVLPGRCTYIGCIFGPPKPAPCMNSNPRSMAFSPLCLPYTNNTTAWRKAPVTPRSFITRTGPWSPLLSVVDFSPHDRRGPRRRRTPALSLVALFGSFTIRCRSGAGRCRRREEKRNRENVVRLLHAPSQFKV